MPTAFESAKKSVMTDSLSTSRMRALLQESEHLILCEDSFLIKPALLVMAKCKVTVELCPRAIATNSGLLECFPSSAI